MNRRYDLMNVPWRAPGVDTPLGSAAAGSELDERAAKLLDELCERLTTVYIAEGMGDRKAYNTSSAQLEQFLRGINLDDLQLMAMFAVIQVASNRAHYATTAIPDTVPTDWNNEENNR